MMGDRTGQHVATYRLIRLLEQGALIDRYLSSDVSSERQVTLLLLASQTDEPGMGRFQRNLPICKRLAHPHISPLLDAGVEDMTPFVLLDHLPTSRQSHQFPLPIPTIVRSVSQLADAFDYAHSQGVWHTYTTPRPSCSDIGARYFSEALACGYWRSARGLGTDAGSSLFQPPISPPSN